MNPHLNTAVNIVKKLGKNIIISFDQLCMKNIKHDEINLYIDFIKNKCYLDIKVIINKLYPNHKIVFKHDDVIDYNSFSWVVGLFDNEINFVRGIKEVFISIAIIYKNCVHSCVIYDVFNNNIFTASKHEGAKLNEKRIKISNYNSIKGSLININFLGSDNYIYYCKYLRFLLSHGAIIRSTGSLSLSLSYFSSGLYDGYIDFNLKKDDYNFIFALRLLINESGGYISDFYGKDLIINNLIASSPKLHSKLIKLVNSVY